MNKEYEAYYSRVYPYVLGVLGVLLAFGIVLASVFWMPNGSLIIVAMLSIFLVTVAALFSTAVGKNGVAVEVIDNKLILHKKCLVEIPIDDIINISIHDGGGSFDLSIKTNAKRHSLHCMVQNQRKKTSELIALLKEKGVKVNLWHSPAVD